MATRRVTQVETLVHQGAPSGPTLEQFGTISLEEMAAVQLLNRTETKFVLREEQAMAALAQLVGRYRVLETNGRRGSLYRTLYYDTADWQLFRRHHAGAAVRFKVRARSYVESDLTFLEVKRKHRFTRRTVKHRLVTSGLATGLDSEAQRFLSGHYPLDAGRLGPRLWNSFTRVTLVSTARCERLTLDLGILFHDGQAASSLGGLVVAEVKQEHLARDSDWMRVMRQWGIRPTGFSKYCIGVALLHPEVRSNRFRPKLLMVQRLMQERRTHVHYQ